MVMVSAPVSARGPLLVARNLEVSGAPCATGFGDLVLEIDKSLPSRCSEKFAVLELLARFASALAALIEAVLLLFMPAGGTIVLSGAVVLIVMLSAELTVMVARVHVTVCRLTEQDQPVPLGTILVKPFGSVSVTVIVLAGSGPALRGSRMKVAALPAIIGAGRALLVICRSEPVLTATVAVSVLLPSTPSAMLADS